MKVNPKIYWAILITLKTRNLKSLMPGCIKSWLNDSIQYLTEQYGPLIRF